MRLFNRRARLERIAETVGDSLDAASALKLDLPDAEARARPLKAGLIAAGERWPA